MDNLCIFLKCHYFFSGIASFIGIGIYGAMQYKNRTMKTSVYLINLRVAAQGAVVVCLGATLLYKVITEELIPKLAGEKKN